jgi:hypothetical protein
MQNDSNYQTYAAYFVKDVPYDNLKYLVQLFMNKAAVNMGNDFNEKTLACVIELIKQSFSYIPVCYVASGFIKGSLGNYDAGRLVPRTIFKWMGEISLEYNRDIAKQKQKEIESTPLQSFDLKKFPLGRAINKKIDWYRENRISIDDWDKISLKELSEMIKRGQNPSVDQFLKTL